MILRELKTSLDKFGHDDDNSHVMLMTTNEITGKMELSLLCGIAMTIGLNAIILADEKQALRMKETGKSTDWDEGDELVDPANEG